MCNSHVFSAVRPTGWLALLALLGLTAGVRPATADAPKGEKYALLVGVHNYSEEKVLHPLAYAEPDVTELAQVLRDSGLAPGNVVLMTQEAAADDPRFMPEKKRVLKELALLLGNRSDKDTVLIAFAGHGVHFKDDKNSYFCPADAQLDDRSTLISLVDVYGQLEKSKAGVKVLLVDACRNDPFQDKSRAARIDLESVTRPQLPDPPKGVIAFFSCSEKEKAYEADKLKHGVFFHYVIEGLKGEAAPDKEEVSLLDLGAYVTRNVGDFVRAEYGQVQQPELAGKTSGSAALLHVDRVNFLFRKGEANLDAQDFDKAVEDFTGALKINPKFLDALTERARAYNNKQAFDKAVADGNAALKVDPKAPAAYFQRAVAYQNLNDLDKAVADYTANIRIDPDAFNAYHNRAYCYVAKEEYDKAIADCTEILRLDPNNTEGCYLRGNAHNCKKEWKKAVADCTEAIRLDPKFVAAYGERSFSYNNLNKADESIADCNEAIRLDPKYALAYGNRGAAYSKKGKYDQAIADFSQNIRLEPKNASIYEYRAAAYKAVGDTKKAEADLQKAKSLK